MHTNEMIEALAQCKQNMSNHVDQAGTLAKANLRDLYDLTSAILASIPESPTSADARQYWSTMRDTLGTAMIDAGLMPSDQVTP